jgi:GcrA cell cycle regulator
MGWTEERVATLRKLWAEGLSASQIAKQLGGVTRNAVIGKVHRLGLAGRATPSRPAKRPVRASRPRVIGPSAPRLRPAHAMPTVVIPDLEPLRLEDGKAASVLTLNESMCKFPIGDPNDADFAFCGRGAVCGPYCQDHARLAYQPSQAKKRRTGEPDELRRMLRLAAM